MRFEEFIERPSQSLRTARCRERISMQTLAGLGGLLRLPR
jgi:hypothetical protein